jgi:TonB-dependent receptor
MKIASQIQLIQLTLSTKKVGPLAVVLILAFSGVVMASFPFEKGSVSDRNAQEFFNGFGIIFGEVRDSTTRESLPGANVVVKGTQIGVATDVDGRYTLRRVPAGQLLVSVTYLGYRSKEIEVTLLSEQSLELNVELEAEFIEGTEVFVVAQQRGQSRALTAQRQAVSIRTVVSSEQIDQFADATVSDALQRVAGMGHGGTNIRGVGAGFAKITMDGQRMGSTEADRSVDLSTLSADMVQQLEVIKVITPDMDADALSGAININTRRPIGGERTMNVRLGGGWNSRFLDQTGLASRLSFSYGDSPRPDFSYNVNLSYQRSNDASEQVRTDWSWQNFPQIEGPSDILTSLQNSITYNPRDRYGAGFQFTIQPTDRTTYYVVTNFNFENRSEEVHTWKWIFRDYFSPFETRGIDNPGRAGDAAYGANLDLADIYQHTARLGARHLFRKFEMEYTLGWGYSQNQVERFRPEYSTMKAYEHRISFDKGNNYPVIDIQPTSFFRTIPGKAQFFNRFDEESRWDFHQNNEFSGSINITIPITRGLIKFGSSNLLAFSDGISERYLLAFQRQINLTNYDSYLGRDFRIFDRPEDTYHMPFIIDVHKIRDFTRTYRPHYDIDLEAWALTAETSFYSAREYTLGNYVMSVLNFGRFRFVGGLRAEYTDSEYEGRAGSIDDEKKFLGAVDTLSTNKYLHFFPNTQLIIGLGRMTNFRVGWTRSIGRPTLNQLSPYVLWDFSSERITQGNAKLDPMISDNIDVMLEHYFMNVGQFTVGFYYKFMKDFIFNTTEVIGPDGVDGEGLYARWIRSGYDNGERARVYGFEVTWQQRMDFLPGFLSYIGFYTNYSYAASEADIDRPGQTTRLQGQRPHVLNVAIDYTKGRFSGQATYAWGSPSITSYGTLDFAPSLYGDSKRVYMDFYRDAANDLSLTLRYKLSNEFRLWADASNILNNRSVSYVYNRDVYPRTQNLSGCTINLGLRYTF